MNQSLLSPPLLSSIDFVRASIAAFQSPRGTAPPRECSSLHPAWGRAARLCDQIGRLHRVAYGGVGTVREEPGQIVMSAREGRIEVDGLLVPSYSLRELPLLSQNDSQVVMGRGIFRVERDDLAVFDRRLVEPSLVTQCRTQVNVGHGAFRVKVDGLAIFADRPVQFALALQCQTQVHVGHDAFWVERDRRAQFCDRLVELSLVTQNVTQIAIGLDELRIELDGLRAIRRSPRSAFRAVARRHPARRAPGHPSAQAR